MKSIDLNIIGTANIVKVCSKLNIKLIYFSTSYIYPNKKGNYKETDPVFPVNNYAWSKLGGESSVHLYKNSLILRLAMTEHPFIHPIAFTNAKNNFIYRNEVMSDFLDFINDFLYEKIKAVRRLKLFKSFTVDKDYDIE